MADVHKISTCSVNGEQTCVFLVADDIPNVRKALGGVTHNEDIDQKFQVSSVSALVASLSRFSCFLTKTQTSTGWTTRSLLHQCPSLSMCLCPIKSNCHGNTCLVLKATESSTAAYCCNYTKENQCGYCAWWCPVHIIFPLVNYHF